MKQIDAKVQEKYGMGLYEWCAQELDNQRDVKDLAAELGLPRSTLNYWLMKAGGQYEHKFVMPSDSDD